MIRDLKLGGAPLAELSPVEYISKEHYEDVNYCGAAEKFEGTFECAIEENFASFESYGTGPDTL